MGTVEQLRPNGQDVEEAWNAFRTMANEATARPSLFDNRRWCARFSDASARFDRLYRAWCGEGRRA